MSDVNIKQEDPNHSKEFATSYQPNDIEKILKAIQTNPHFKAQFQNLLLVNSLAVNKTDRPKAFSSELKLETPSDKAKCETFSEEDDLDSASSSENKEISENGKISLAEKVKHDLANINSKLIKKKSITKKRWWTPEEVYYSLNN